MRVTVLSGGVGGAKLVEGLAALVPPGRLTVIANPGDDIDLLGLRIQPDLDIVLYTLAGIVDRRRGWGISGETFAALNALRRLEGPAWFALGDRDIATHLLRTRLLAEGRRPTDVALEIGRRLGVRVRVIPPTDDTVRTFVRTPSGLLPFQDFFVRLRCRPRVLGVEHRGGARARPTREALEALRRADVIAIAPSNPIASIGPILAVRGIRAALRRAQAVRVGVSPLVGGRSLKGPSDRMMRAAGFRADAAGVAGLYRGLLDVLVVDRADRRLVSAVERTGIRTVVAETVVRTPAERVTLGRVVLSAARGFRR